MNGIMLRRLALFFLALTTAALCCFPALADPYPSNVQATPVNATSILVTWTGNAQAESYRIHRMNWAEVPEVSSNDNSYLDTALAPGIPYVYNVASVVDGNEYYASGTSAIAMPMDTPEITAVSSRVEADYEGHYLLLIDLAYTASSGASGYEIFAKVGDGSGYAQVSETVETSVTTGFPLPAETTRYWLKVRAYTEYHISEANEDETYHGSFSSGVFIDYHPLTLSRPLDVFLYERIWPWEDPWAGDYLRWILEMYGNPDKWPQDIVPDTAALAELAERLAAGAELSGLEKQMAEAIHPHGLALLTGAYASPPGEEQAHTLEARLKALSGLLDGKLPDALTGETQQAYFAELAEVCPLVSLTGILEPGAGATSLRFRITMPDTGRILLGTIPSLGPLPEGLLSATPSPTAAPLIPVLSFRPFVITILTPAPTPSQQHWLRP